MKSLIKLCTILVLFTITSDSFGQTFGIKAGLNLSKMYIDDSEFFLPYDYTNSDNFKIKPAFNIGGVVEIPVFSLLAFETGLFVSSEGYIMKEVESFGTIDLVTKEKHSLYYLDIPLVAKVPFSVGGFILYGSFGGYGGIGLIGTIKTVATFGDLVETETETIEWGSVAGTDYLRRIDYGLTFGAGVELASFQLGFSYKMGLSNISPEYDYGSVINNRVIGVSLGYMFGGPKKSVEAKPIAENLKKERVKEKPVKEAKTKENKPKSEKTTSDRLSGRQKATIEAERARLEQLRTDSIAMVRAEEEIIRIGKARTDSIEAASVSAQRLEEEIAIAAKIKADSIAAAQKAADREAAKNAVVFRVQFASTTTSKGSYKITIAGMSYNTWEYLYKGAYRSTAGEFSTLAEAAAFQKLVRQSGYAQGFVVAFKNNIRSTDPALFK